MKIDLGGVTHTRSIFTTVTQKRPKNFPKFTVKQQMHCLCLANDAITHSLNLFITPLLKWKSVRSQTQYIFEFYKSLGKKLKG